MSEANTHANPSALPPTEAELAAWQALSRDEQIARYREELLTPGASRVSQSSMADILAAARLRATARRG